MILGMERGSFDISKGASSQIAFSPHCPSFPPSLPPLLGVAKLSESLSLSDPDMHSQLLWQALEKQFC